MKNPVITIDGNEATTSVAHRLNEVIAIYPITPSSGMGEFADEWSVKGQRNLWGTIPLVVEMQSEGSSYQSFLNSKFQSFSQKTTRTPQNSYQFSQKKKKKKREYAQQKEQEIKKEDRCHHCQNSMQQQQP